MIIVQHIETRWTKASRGMPGAALRNAVPRALPLEPVPEPDDGGPVLAWWGHEGGQIIPSTEQQVRRMPYTRICHRRLTPDIQTMWKQIPAWLRPPLLGAIALLGTVGMPMLAAIVLLPETRAVGQLMEASRTLAIAVAAGAVGGLTFSFLGAPLLRIPFAGRSLAGTACVLTYLGFCIAAFEGWAALYHGWGTILAFSVGFGILLGFFLPAVKTGLPSE